MDKKVFVVERWGAYQRGLVGVYSTLNKATDAKHVAQSLEPDDYHDFTVDECTIDPEETYATCSHCRPDDTTT